MKNHAPSLLPSPGDAEPASTPAPDAVSAADRTTWRERLGFAILAIARIWDGITDPVMGSFSDNFRSRWGRRRPFIALGALLCALTFPLEAGLAGAVMVLAEVRPDNAPAVFALEGDVVLSDSGTGDWTQHWFLDGKVGRVENRTDGMVLAAGQKAGQDADHVVLWTRRQFSGDIRIDFDYVRLDREYRFVNILYLFARGKGHAPYAADIMAWRDLRASPKMAWYFDHMHAYHISFAAFGDGRTTPEINYVRARRYRPDLGSGLEGTELQPDDGRTTLFEPGVRHHITAIRRGGRLYFRITTAHEVKDFSWSTADAPPLESGRIGFRLMWRREAVFSNIEIRQLPAQVPAGPPSCQEDK